MAAPIAHIFLAVQMLSGPFKGMFNEKEFLVGTSFPDIRYLKVVARTKTHFSNVTLKDIMQEPDSFKAGMLFHSFVDEQREAYVVKHLFYEKIPTFRLSTQSLKFAEDEILKSEFDITQYQSCFDEILEAERAYGITEEHILNWHMFLQNYIGNKYSIKDFAMKYFDLNKPNAWFFERWLFSWLYARKIKQTVSTIVSDKHLKNLILDFYLNFSEKYNFLKR